MVPDVFFNPPGFLAIPSQSPSTDDAFVFPKPPALDGICVVVSFFFRIDSRWPLMNPFLVLRPRWLSHDRCGSVYSPQGYPEDFLGPPWAKAQFPFSPPWFEAYFPLYLVVYGELPSPPVGWKDFVSPCIRPRYPGAPPFFLCTFFVRSSTCLVPLFNDS